MLKLRKTFSVIRRFSDTQSTKSVEDPIPSHPEKTKVAILGKTESIFPSPIASSFSYEIRGKEFNAVDIKLTPGQSINARAGCLSYMDQNVSFSTSLTGGIATSLNRSVSGSTIFLTKYSNTSSIDEALLMLSPPHPSKIVPVDLQQYSGKLICHRDSFLCGDSRILVTARYILNPIFGFWGGEGFAFQQLEGEGVGLIAGGGVIVKKTLKDGEEIRLTPGSILAFDSSIQFKMIAISGIRNIVFGQGMFFLMLKGPGDVFIQTMPFQKIAKGMFGWLTKYWQKQG